MEAETAADASRGVPRVVLFLHRLATYGESEEVAADRRRDWDSHLSDASSGGVSDTGLVFAAVSSLFVHVGWRCRHGTPTAIPAGLLVTLVALAAMSFVLTSESHYPPALHLHIALGLLATGWVFLRHPRQIPDRGLVTIGVLVGSSMAHGLWVFSLERPSDAVLFSGAVVLIAGCGGLVSVAVGNALGLGRFSVLRRRSFEVLALGTILFSLGNLTAYQIAEDPVYAMTSLFSASLTLLTANAIMRVRGLC